MSPFAWFIRLFSGAPNMSETPSPKPQEGAAGPTAEDLATNLAVQFEGFSAVPYPDPATNAEPWTIGYGSTHDMMGKPITKDHPPITETMARQWIAEDMRIALAGIRDAVKAPLTVQETAAIEDFIYNLGIGAFRNSTLCRLINLGKLKEAAQQFDLWDHANGKVMAGLLRRRQAEEDEFLSTSPPAPV